MRYRAIADGLSKDGHPVQVLGHNLENIREWARMMADSEKCRVRIFKTEESLLETVKPCLTLTTPNS